MRIKTSIILLAFFSLAFFAIPSIAQSAVLGNRTVNLVNQCPFPVWFGFISGAMPNKAGNTCQTDADCYEGGTCVDRGAGGKACFWKNPIPQDKKFELAANGGKNSVQIPIYQNGLNYAWSGAIAGRTGCENGKCETADCNAGTGGCPTGAGFLPPVTQAEITFNNDQRDYYDVEVVNGMNIPVEMAPIFIPNQRSQVQAEMADDPYYCGNPGGVTPLTSAGTCTWKMSPPSNDYKWVAQGGPTCTADSDCQNNSTCGLSFDPQKKPQFQKTCGKLLGYWSADQVCGQDKNYGEPFNCAKPLPAPYANLTMFNMYGCAPIDSCYKKDATTDCCGCVNWNEVGIDVPKNTAQCVKQNQFWLDNVKDKLSWVKQACPTAYTYPFDDPSSTFACDNMQPGKINTIGYTITFCPGGQTGGV